MRRSRSDFAAMAGLACYESCGLVQVLHVIPFHVPGLFAHAQVVKCHVPAPVPVHLADDLLNISGLPYPGDGLLNSMALLNCSGDPAQRFLFKHPLHLLSAKAVGTAISPCPTKPRRIRMNQKQKQAFKGLVAELRDVIPQEDRSKLEQLERIVGRAKIVAHPDDRGMKRRAADRGSAKSRSVRRGLEVVARSLLSPGVVDPQQRASMAVV